jgi:2-amino-4-hydroxy-6-hydroxymethyldihydropteridine diphosphokinase
MVDVAYIALGSNLGDRGRYLTQARAALAALPGSRVVGESSVEETEPVGPPGQGRFLNQIVALETELEPRALLAALQEVERANGRVRRERWGPRTLDLDIVCFDRQELNEPGLVVPHPELAHRDFWRRELNEVVQGARDDRGRP